MKISQKLTALAALTSAKAELVVIGAMAIRFFTATPFLKVKG